MRAVRTVAILAAAVLPRATMAGEEVTIEGSLSVGFCGMFPAIPVCMLRAEGGGDEYALPDMNGDGSYDLTDGIECLQRVYRKCWSKVQVHGVTGDFWCGDPIEGFPIDAIWSASIVIHPLACGDVDASGAIDNG